MQRYAKPTTTKEEMDFRADFQGPETQASSSSSSSSSSFGGGVGLVAFFHVFFRLSSLLVYLFGSWFSSSFIGVFVAVTFTISCALATRPFPALSGFLLLWQTGHT